MYIVVNLYIDECLMRPINIEKMYFTTETKVVLISRVVLIKSFLYGNFTVMRKGSGGLMVKVSASQPPDHGFERHMGHDHDSS